MMKLDGLERIEWCEDLECYVKFGTIKCVAVKKEASSIPFSINDRGLYSRLDLVVKFKHGFFNAYSSRKLEELSDERVYWYELQYFVIKEV